MKFNYSPNEIKIYRDFPVEPEEIRLEFTNDGPGGIYIYQRVVIRDNSLIPVAEGRLVWQDVKDDAKSILGLDAGEATSASLVIDLENLSLLNDNQEYNAIIQYSNEYNFAWTDKLLENLDTFRDWNDGTGMAVLDEIAQLLPVEFASVPFHVRTLRERGDYTLCMDFGTSFSACAIAINPARSSELACYKPGEKKRGIYFTKFMDGTEAKNIVPSVVVLKKIVDDTQAEWLCGYDAVEWAKKNPEKGSFITDVKGLLLNLHEKMRLADQDNLKREFSNEEIVTAFLRFLVERSKRYFGINFKKIHITTPVTYPERQRKAYEHVLGKLGFTDIKSQLDEARAPLYYFFSRTVEKAWNKDMSGGGRDIGNKPISYLIIDCGGGSTDATLLRDIELTFPGGDAGRGIKLKTQEPKKGGFDFGGSDLTDLLFHYLKMRIFQAAYPGVFARLHPALAEPQSYLIDSLIESQVQNIFWDLYRLERNEANEKIPVLQHNYAYERFNEISEELEKYFPTNEKLNSELDNASWEKIHRNKNTLWQLAEALKISIFANDTPRKLNLLDLRDAPEAIFWLRDPENMELTKVDAERFYKAQLEFDDYELKKLFRPIIFKEISRIFRQLEIQKDLSDKNAFFNVRFVGQSTNIPLFKEALSYFVPQAMIEEENKEYQATGESRFQPIAAEDKKICCVKGAAQFLSHVTSGYLKDDKFVAPTRVLKNFCRFGRNGEPITAGVYDYRGRPAQQLIACDALLKDARGAILRDLSDEMEELFGTTFDEKKELEGYILLHREDMTHELSEDEAKTLSDRWGELFGKLQADENGPAVLIETCLLEDGAAQRYEFRPYYWDSGKQSYMTTPEPGTMIFVGD